MIMIIIMIITIVIIIKASIIVTISQFTTVIDALYKKLIHRYCITCNQACLIHSLTT